MLESNSVTLYSTENEEKSSVPERWNRTMKRIMWKYFTANNTNKYIDELQNITGQLSSVHQMRGTHQTASTCLQLSMVKLDLETRKELEPMKKTLADIDGALKPVAAPQPSENVDTTFGIYSRKDRQLQMGSEIVGVNQNTVGDREYDLTPGLRAFIMQKHPQVSQWSSRDYRTYKSLATQTKVKSHPNPRGSTRPHAT